MHGVRHRTGLLSATHDTQITKRILLAFATNSTETSTTEWVLRCVQAFEDHQEKQHNTWNYFAFLMSLHVRRLEEEDFMASEFYVWDQYKKGQYEFFPMRRSIEVEKLKSKDEDGVASLQKKFETVSKANTEIKKTQMDMKRSQDLLLKNLDKLMRVVESVKANTTGTKTDHDDDASDSYSLRSVTPSVTIASEKR